MRMWNVLVRSRLIEQYKRKEVVVTTDANCPQDPNPLDKLFQQQQVPRTTAVTNYNVHSLCARAS